MDEHIPEAPPSKALVPASAPASTAVRPSGLRLSDSMLLVHDVQKLMYKALDQLDELGDRIANAAGLR